MPVKSEAQIKSIYSATSITSGATAISGAIDLSNVSYLGAWYQSASAVAASGVRLYYEMSWDDTNANYVIPMGVSDIESLLNGTAAKVISLSPPPMRYIRFKTTCSTAAATDLTFTMKLFMQ